jgi:hypothetical protein
MITNTAISSISVNPFSSDTSISLFISTPDQQITASGCRVSQFIWVVFVSQSSHRFSEEDDLGAKLPPVTSRAPFPFTVTLQTI